MGETQRVLRELTSRLEEPDRLLALNWKEGDLAIVDNLALAHYASPGTQAPREEVGLRILHRTTVGGGPSPVPLHLSERGEL